MNPPEAGAPDEGAVPTPGQARPAFPVVGIGASAGGIAALTRLFEGLPATPGMAFVIVMHLSPRHESSAAEIVQRATSMTVRQVEQDTPIEPDHVYVIPPGQGLSMVDGHLSLGTLRRDRGRHIVIDLFFRTLAQVHGTRAIAVVLSGSGADGSAGIGEIKAQGGVVIAQSPEDAEFDGMPASAIATGKVDIVLPAPDIGARLLELWHNMQRIQLPEPQGRDAGAAGGSRPNRPSSRCARSWPRCSRAPGTISSTTSAPPCCAASKGGCRSTRCRICRPTRRSWRARRRKPARCSATCSSA